METASDETSIVAGEVTGASGMPTDILDTPASVSVVTAAEIEQRGAESVEEVLQYTPGVLTDNWGADERFDAFRIRGFNAFTYRDGLLLGLAQSLALIPGVSRSGATTTAGLALGYTRPAAAEVAFLAAAVTSVVAFLTAAVASSWMSLPAASISSTVSI